MASVDGVGIEAVPIVVDVEGDAVGQSASGGVGVWFTYDKTFCLDEPRSLTLSGAAAVANLHADDVLRWQLDGGTVHWYDFYANVGPLCCPPDPSGTCEARGGGGVGPAIDLGTVGAGPHTLTIRVYNCAQGAQSVGNLYLV